MAGFIEPRDTKKGRRFDARWRDASGMERSKSFQRQADAKEHLRRLAAREIGGARETVAWLADEFLGEKKALVETSVLERITYTGYEKHLRLLSKA